MEKKRDFWILFMLYTFWNRMLLMIIEHEQFCCFFFFIWKIVFQMQQHHILILYWRWCGKTKQKMSANYSYINKYILWIFHFFLLSYYRTSDLFPFSSKKKKYIYIYIYNRPIGIMSKVFTNGLGDQVSIPGWVILQIEKMVLDPSLLNTQHYKV